MSRAEMQRLRAALQEADTIMGHDDAETEWREKWAGLWATDSASAPIPPMTPAELLEVIGARDLFPLTEALCRKVEAAVVARCGRVLG